MFGAAASQRLNRQKKSTQRHWSPSRRCWTSSYELLCTQTTWFSLCLIVLASYILMVWIISWFDYDYSHKKYQTSFKTKGDKTNSKWDAHGSIFFATSNSLNFHTVVLISCKSCCFLCAAAPAVKSMNNHEYCFQLNNQFFFTSTLLSPVFLESSEEIFLCCWNWQSVHQHSCKFSFVLTTLQKIKKRRLRQDTDVLVLQCRNWLKYTRAWWLMCRTPSWTKMPKISIRFLSAIKRGNHEHMLSLLLIVFLIMWNFWSHK